MPLETPEDLFAALCAFISERTGVCRGDFLRVLEAQALFYRQHPEAGEIVQDLDD